ncbi:phosphoglycerate mutase family protein [Besnoitia besnoiti]|uniref:Phosphoglycerate mutase family protein n=1 Tax=Besnoitia besnoiti TaxID=94643 RepID=A0A2A9MJF6_BESBE|nr:phosphoglycerate mutase family protein [Besnoitia besnoiti]PFH35512.1 phosphoglycerate mutase family protein [Besnoitia besnoiti]
MDPASDEVPPSERPSTAPGCAGLATRGPAIRRKRFYLIRHGQSMNNAVSLNDQAPTDDVSASPRPAALEPLGPSTAAGECAAGRRPAPSASPAPGSPPSEESFGPCGTADDDATRRIRATGRAPDPP